MVASPKPPDPLQGTGITELQLFRLFCMAGAIVYPVWGLICGLIEPGSLNDWPGRLAVAGLFAVLAVVGWVRPPAARRAEALLAVACTVLTVHYFYLVWLNHSSAFFLAGLFITLGTLDASFTRLELLAGYSAAVLGGAVVVALAAQQPTDMAALLVAGVITEQLLFGLALWIRARLTRRLAEANAALRELHGRQQNLINGVYHDLRTPLASIVGFKELMEEGIGGPVTTEQLGFLDQIGRAADRLELLVEDLLDYARLEGGTLAPHLVSTDLTRLVRDSVESMGPQATTAGVAIGLVAPAEGLMVSLDAPRITRVVLNLLSNAVKFSPSGGRVQLALGVDGGDVLVEVEDTGPGIDPADLPKLFRPFSQLESGPIKKQGVGLGLWIGKALVEAHGGSIGVRGGQAGGAVFWFRLPL
ncbi:MAG: protein of unknown function, putative Histidine kinase [Cyanobacteria bacterium RYN_339]|nr:protein of unknown function, putative Histidine kinase [Cyanobacteria bacterium RYN_339]